MSEAGQSDASHRAHVRDALVDEMVHTLNDLDPETRDNIIERVEDIKRRQSMHQPLHSTPKSDAHTQGQGRPLDASHSDSRDHQGHGSHRPVPSGNSDGSGAPCQGQVHTNLAAIKLPTFSGDGKGEVPYKQWRYQVRCLTDEGHHSHSAIMHLIRQSVRGTAAGILMYLGPQVNLEVVLLKLDSVFGPAYTAHQLKDNFHAARQRLDESTVSWYCRLQNLMGQLKEVKPPDDEEDLLRSKFFYGLVDKELRDSIRPDFNNGKTFDELFLAAKAVTNEDNSDINEPTLLTSKPKAKLQKASQVSQQAAKPSSVNEPQAASSTEELRIVRDELKAVAKRLSALEARSDQGQRSRSQGRGNVRDSNRNRGQRTSNASASNGDRLRLWCERCGHRGHTRDQCHAKKDVEGHPLN